jgi:hypothetical protein
VNSPGARRDYVGLLLGGLGESSDSLDQADIDSSNQGIVVCLNFLSGECSDFGWVLVCFVMKWSEGSSLYVRHTYF